MADEQQLAILRQGRDVWNAWREQNRDVRADLSEADLSGMKLPGVDLSGVELSRADLSQANLAGAYVLAASLAETNLSAADLSRAKLSSAHLPLANLTGANLSLAHLPKAYLYAANLSKADLYAANLSEATLSEANLSEANLSKARFSEANLLNAKLMGASLSEARLSEANFLNANLSGANLSKANLSKANLLNAKLSGANLSRADLSRADLVNADFTSANLTGCRVYGISAWDLELDGAKQKDLIITPYGEPEITVDNLEVAQFIYLLLNNERIRHVIDTITSKVVLILGRFTRGRKAALDALREELRQRDYLPVLFDFDTPRSRSTLETVSTLAHMARFVIADLTDAKSVLQELQAVVPTNPSVPVQPLILATQEEPGMFDFFRRYPWMLEPYRYPNQMGLLAALKDSVIAPAELVLSKADPAQHPVRFG